MFYRNIHIMEQLTSKELQLFFFFLRTTTFCQANPDKPHISRKVRGQETAMSCDICYADNVQTRH